MPVFLGRLPLDALAALTVVLGMVSAVRVVRIGDSGARAAWAEKQYTAPRHQHG
jgi:hypothetical protein